MDESKLLYIGPLAIDNTCYSRLAALRGLTPSICTLDKCTVLQPHSSRFAALAELLLGRSVRLNVANRSILRVAQECRARIVWIDKGDWVFPKTVKQLQSSGVRVVLHTTDSLRPRQKGLYIQQRFARVNAELVDVFITTNERDNAYLLPRLGLRLRLSRMGYDAKRFSPTGANHSSPAEHLRSELCFVGHYEPQTGRFVEALIAAGLPVTVYGGSDWCRSAVGRKLGAALRPPVWGDDYVSAIRGARIGLCFLSAWNYNLTTVRSFEIPACGTLLLAMHTVEHEKLYSEGKEAVFFRGTDSLVLHSRQLLADDKQRSSIAKAGMTRCLSSRYSWDDVVSDDWAAVTSSLGL